MNTSDTTDWGRGGDPTEVETDSPPRLRPGAVQGAYLVERMFGDRKHFRRVATRYDKTARSFLSFGQLAASYLWLK